MDENPWSQNENITVRYYAEGIALADTWKVMEKLVDLKLIIFCKKKKNFIITNSCPLANLKRLNELEEETSVLYNTIIKQIVKEKNRITA
ncbi:unnamed protein product [Rotaria sp. Silwood2]|nr:unnamed protein product [Rotaria sp. Silwood2]CAF4446719.1 unnamed protein product [Rotaria sp. Silwood2]